MVLPTGAGKTLIAAKAAEANVAATKQPTLFLVPTKLLVAQQAQAFVAATSLRVTCLHGELAVPAFATFDALVATPAAMIAQQGCDDLSFQQFGLVVFDEVHHVVKNHPYRKVAVRLQNLPEASRPKVLGLSASLTYAIGKGATLFHLGVLQYVRSLIPQRFPTAMPCQGVREQHAEQYIIVYRGHQEGRAEALRGAVPVPQVPLHSLR